MREFKGNPTMKWEYGEKQVTEIGTEKSFTLTQPNIIFREDYYFIRRAIAVDNCPVDVIPEPSFYVYEFAYLIADGCLVTKIIDRGTAYELIETNLPMFMEGEALSAIEDFFERRFE